MTDDLHRDPDSLETDLMDSSAVGDRPILVKSGASASGLDAISTQPPGGSGVAGDAGWSIPMLQQHLWQQLRLGVVVVDQHNRVLFVDGDTDRYVKITSGAFHAASPDVLEVSQNGIGEKLRAALRKFWNDQSPTTVPATVSGDDGSHAFEMRISKMPERPGHDAAAMVVFVPVQPATHHDPIGPAGESDGTISPASDPPNLFSALRLPNHSLPNHSVPDHSLVDVKQELLITREELNHSISNLKSANEALTTLNCQLEIKVNQLEDTTNDLENLLASSDIPTVFLDPTICIRRYTPSCRDLFQFIGGDIGQSLEDIERHFVDPDLMDDARSVLRDLQPREKQVTTTDGRRHFRRRMLPYRTEDDRTEGVVMTLSDITELRNAQDIAQRQLAENQTIYASAPIGLGFVDTELRYRSINQRLAEIDGLSVDEHIGKRVDKVLPKKLADVVLQYYHHVLRTGLGIYDQEIVGRTKGGQTERTYLASYVPVLGESGETLGVNTVVADITERKRNESDVVIREAHLRRVIDNTMNFVGELDRDGVLLDANRTALAAANLTRQDVIGKPFWECYWWSHDDEAASKLRQAIKDAQDGKIVRYDAEVRMAGDSRMIIDFMLSPVIDEDGNVTHLIPSAVDITDKHATREALKNHKERLQMALQAGGLAAWQWTEDRSTWEPELFQLLGLPADAEASTELFFKHIHPDDLPDLKRAWQHATDGNDGYYQEFRIIDRRGRIRWLAGTGTVVNDAEGNVKTIYGLNWDITEKKEFENEVKLNNERMRIAGISAGFGNFHVDVEHNRVHWSREMMELIGLGPDADQNPAVGAVPDFVHPDDREKVQRYLDRVLSDLDEPDHTVEHRIIRPDGEVLAVRMHSRSLYEGEGQQKKIQTIVGTLFDITQQQEYERKLKDERRRAQAANESKSEFVANMSHEIRTPMTAVIGYADILFAMENDPAKIEHLETIKRNGNFLLEIINDILDLSKIEAGKLDLSCETFSLQEVVSEVISMMKIRAGENQLSVGIDYDSPIPKQIQSDPKRLKQILVNLFGNAIKFTKRGGVRLVVGFEALPEPVLRFSVIDTGIGISVDQQQKLFEPFTQADMSVNREFGGTGLGLAICRRLTNMLGGDISVHSKPDHGSTFTFTIATGQVNPSEMVIPDHQAAKKVDKKTSQSVRLSCNALVVDDSPDIRHLATHFLKKYGAAVEQAEDGEDALAHVVEAFDGQKTVPDIVILDMQMPRLDGFQTASQLREIGFKNPIVALTADAMQGDMEHCLKSGCNAYLSKPIDARALIETVDRFTKKET